jgi:hypothetical protein
LLVFPFMLLLQWLACVELNVPQREPGNENECSGKPLEAMGWKKCSGCTR